MPRIDLDTLIEEVAVAESHGLTCSDAVIGFVRAVEQFTEKGIITPAQSEEICLLAARFAARLTFIRETKEDSNARTSH